MIAGFIDVSPGFDRRAQHVLGEILARLPAMEGKPVRLGLQPALTAHRGRLLSGQETGTPVHAGSFPRRREIVLDNSLCQEPAELARILVHELFHFVWLRMGNPARRSFEELLAAEFRRGVRGELGWSAGWRKKGLTSRDLNERTRRWREYVCESFCDSAAWLHAGVVKHGEFTLAQRFRNARREWLCHFEAAGRIPI